MICRQYLLIIHYQYDNIIQQMVTVQCVHVYSCVLCINGGAGCYGYRHAIATTILYYKQ